MESEYHKMNDHDLLIALHEQIKQVRTDIKDLKDGTSSTLTNHESRIRLIENNSIDKKDYEWLQRVVYGGLGVLATVQFYFQFIKQ